MRTLAERAANLLGVTRIDGKVATVPRHGDRTALALVHAELRRLGGVMDRPGRYVFADDPSPMVEDALLAAGPVTADAWNVPQHVAQQVVRAAAAHRRPGAMVLEPSAGRGALLRAIPRVVSVVAVEADDRCISPLSSELASFGDDRWSVSIADFLSVDPTPVFDCVVMCPPLGDGRDLTHVAHASKFLAQGGRLAAVMAAGVTYRTDERTAAFRAGFLAAGGTFEPMQSGSLRGAGTSVNTVLAVVERQ